MMVEVITGAAAVKELGGEQLHGAGGTAMGGA